MNEAVTDPFDDEPSRVPPRASVVRSIRRVIQQAQRLRLPPPDITVSPAARAADLGEVDTGDDILGTLLGVVADEDGTGPFTPASSPDFPITQGLYHKFQASMPAPKVVRVDTEESYEDFLAGKRAPYVKALAARLTALESTVANHAADNHAGGRVAALEQALADHVHDASDPFNAIDHDDVLGAVDAAKTAGSQIPLSLPPWAAGKVSCWQDGSDIYCSMRWPGPDGKVRIATTSSPAARHVDEVLGYAAAADVDPVEVMDVLPALAQILGGGALVTQLARSAPALLARPEVKAGGSFIGTITPVGDPQSAAVMALVQLGETGNGGAQDEVSRLRATSGGAAIIADAEKKLAKARKKLGRV